MIALLWLLLSLARADDRAAYAAWLSTQAVTAHPEPRWRSVAELHADIAPFVVERPGVVEPVEIGQTVKGEPIWAFKVTNPAGPPAQRKMLVFGQLHPLEWIGAEVATAFLENLAADPPPGVETWVIPIVNLDGRRLVEGDLAAGEDRYRRTNSNRVDLNRDFAVNRSSEAIWRHIIPNRYTTSPAPLSQPETQALDALANRERFHAAVSLHAFGGYIYYPWAGRWERAPDRQELHRLGQIMASAQGPRAYTVKQLARWAFFFRGLGMELDHLYETYGTMAFLMECTRSGMEPLRPSTWRGNFRLYNPVDPAHHTRQGVQALRALAEELERQAAAP